MSFDYKTFDPKTFQAFRPLKHRTVIGAETTKKFIQLVTKKLPKKAERISAAIEYSAPVTRYRIPIEAETTQQFIQLIQSRIPQTAERINGIIEYLLPTTRALEPEITRITKITTIPQQPTDPTHTILAWNEFGNKVSDTMNEAILTPPTTQEALDEETRIMLATLLDLFENNIWLFMMKGDFFAYTEMNRLSPDFRFSTQWTPADDLLLTSLMEGVTKYLTEWTSDIRTEATEAMSEHTGESAQQIGDAVAQAIQSESHRGTLIARTEVMRAFNRMADQRFNNAGLESDWLTAHDAIVCERCEFKDGKPTKEVGIPPEHPDCRCTHVPRLR
jgi:hypothetical protein